MTSALSGSLVTLSAIVVFILCAGCQAGRSQAKNDIESVASEKLGKSVKVDYNVSRTYALCRQSPTDSHARRTYKFIVIRVSDGSVVHEGKFQMGYAKWVDDRTIEIQNQNDIASDERSAQTISRIEIDSQLK